jgi:hypothetical protein
MCKCMCSHAGISNQVEDRFCSDPLFNVVGLPPLIQLSHDPVYEILFFAGLEKDRVAFVIQTAKNLF